MVIFGRDEDEVKARLEAFKEVVRQMGQCKLREQLYIRIDELNWILKNNRGGNHG